MARRTVEVLSGIGEIWAGERLFRTTTYRIELIAEDGRSDPAVEGRLDISGWPEALVLARAPELTLLLDDGRHVVFALASASGEIRVSGGLQGVETSRR